MNLLSWLPIGRVPEIDADALHQMMTEDDSAPQIVDVRTWLQYQRAHIHNATHAPTTITSFKSRLSELQLDRSRAFVVICATAHRSIPAVRMLRRMGFDARQLQGGLIAWNGRHLPLSKEVS